MHKAAPHPRPGRCAVTAEMLSCGEQAHSSAPHPWYGVARRSGSGSGGPTHPSRKSQPGSRCRSWLQSHHDVAGELCSQSEMEEGETRGLEKQQWSGENWTVNKFDTTRPNVHVGDRISVAGCTSGTRKPPLILSPKGMVRFHMTRVSSGKISFSSAKNLCRFSL